MSYFAIGVMNPKREVNIGSLWRTAHLYDAAFVFTIGGRYRRQKSDTPNTPASTPLFHFEDFDTMRATAPIEAEVVGVELDPRAKHLPGFVHPPNGIYLLGAEDHGIPTEVLDRCDSIVQIPSARPQSMNVANAGAVVAFHRYSESRAFRQSATATTEAS